MKKEQPDVAHELRDPELPVVRGAASDSRDILPPRGATPATGPHNQA